MFALNIKSASFFWCIPTRQCLWIVGVAIAELETVLVYSFVHEHTPDSDYALVAVGAKVRESNLCVGQHLKNVLVIFSCVFALQFAATDSTHKECERAAALV